MRLGIVQISFDFEITPNISQEDINEVKKKITKTENTLKEKLPKYLHFLEQQHKNGDYFEIHLPIFEYGITIMMSKLRDKFLISVLDQRNSIVFGNLLIEGYRCMDIKELKKLGTWSAWKKVRMSVFRPD